MFIFQIIITLSNMDGQLKSEEDLTAKPLVDNNWTCAKTKLDRAENNTIQKYQKVMQRTFIVKNLNIFQNSISKISGTVYEKVKTINATNYITK